MFCCIKASITSMERQNKKINFQHFDRWSVSEYGPKNARLICIRDDNSIIEPEDEKEETNNKKHEEKETNKEVHMVSSDTQTEAIPVKEKVPEANVYGNQVAKVPKMRVKISRLPKNDKQLNLLPKELMINIVQYKLELHKLSRNNPMYKKSSTVIPWLLMGK